MLDRVVRVNRIISTKVAVRSFARLVDAACKLTRIQPLLGSMPLSLPTGADRFFTIYIENAGHQSDPCVVSATKTSDRNLPIIIRI
jgi:hypothetical protein